MLIFNILIVLFNVFTISNTLWFYRKNKQKDVNTILVNMNQQLTSLNQNWLNATKSASVFFDTGKNYSNAHKFAEKYFNNIEQLDVLLKTLYDLYNIKFSFYRSDFAINEFIIKSEYSLIQSAIYEMYVSGSNSIDVIFEDYFDKETINEETIKQSLRAGVGLDKSKLSLIFSEIENNHCKRVFFTRKIKS